MRKLKTILSDIIYQLKDDYGFFKYAYRLSSYHPYKFSRIYYELYSIYGILYAIPYRIYHEAKRD